MASRWSWEETVRYAGRLKKCLCSTFSDSGLVDVDVEEGEEGAGDGEGEGAMLKVSPAPSQSFAVINGVCTYVNSSF